MPTLRELEGQLIKCVEEASLEKDDAGRYVFRDAEGDAYMWSAKPAHWTFEYVDNISEAHGISFLCPKSFAKNGGNKGTHSIYIFFKGSPHAGRNSAGEEVRWQVVGGTTIDDLQLTPSIQEQDDAHPLEYRCNWHGFIGSSGVLPGHAQ